MDKRVYLFRDAAQKLTNDSELINLISETMIEYEGHPYFNSIPMVLEEAFNKVTDMGNMLEEFINDKEAVRLMPDIEITLMKCLMTLKSFTALKKSVMEMRESLKQ